MAARRFGYWYQAVEGGIINLPTQQMWSPSGGPDEYRTATAIYLADEGGCVELALVSDVPELLANGWSTTPTHKPALAPKIYGLG